MGALSLERVFMRNAFVLFLGLVVAPVLFAKPVALNTLAEARAAKKAIGYVMDIYGVNGLGITWCNPETGQRQTDRDADFVYCVVVNTSTREAEEKLNEFFPAGEKVKNVFVVVQYVSRILPRGGF